VAQRATPSSTSSERSQPPSPANGELEATSPDPVESPPSRWVNLLLAVTPPTLFVALLYYFGYVRTSSFYSFFGLDVESLSLSYEDFLLRSIQAVYVPFGILLLLTFTVVWARYWTLRAIRLQKYTKTLRRIAYISAVLGMLVFTLGVAGIVTSILSWPLLTPLLLGGGALIFGGGFALLLAQRKASHPDARYPRRVSVTVLIGVVTLSLFWAAQDYALGFGRGRAYAVSRDLGRLPQIVIDTRDRLDLTSSFLHEESLTEGSDYRFRYTGFRLLAESNGRLFLISEDWTQSAGEILMLSDDQLRVWFLAPCGGEGCP
jgi:hypothetical protein